MFDYAYRFVTMNRTLWASVVLAILGMGFLLGGSLLIASSKTLIQKAVAKVDNRFVSLR